MAFSPQNLAQMVIAFASFLAATYADSYIVDKETDESLLIAAVFFVILAVLLFLLSIYFLWRFYRRGSEKYGTKTAMGKDLYHVSVKQRNQAVHAGQQQQDNPFQKHGKYSQKRTMYENMYLPHYETVIGPNQNEDPKTVEARHYDNVYLPGTSSSSFRPQSNDDGDYSIAYDPSESSGKEKRDHPVTEKDQRDARMSEKDNTIAMTTVVTREVVHSRSDPANENHAYDDVDETDGRAYVG